MNRKYFKWVSALLLFSLNLTQGNLEAKENKPLVIQEQGSFSIGGTVVTTPGTYDPIKRNPEGQTLHGDHAYIFYQIPAKARKFPLIFLHGAGQSSKTWETTPDGREGFQNIFLRRGFGVYLIDQPRRGDAGRTTLPIAITTAPDDQFWFGLFRVGNWPNYYPGVQFSQNTETLNQYFRQMTPNTGPFDPEIISDAISALFNKTGQGILVTHSQGGGPGWLTAIKNKNVGAIVAYEPGSGFIFPEGEVPAPMPSSAGPLSASGIPLEEFKHLTQIPIIIYYGDNIPQEPSPNPSQDNWRVRLEMAKIWVDTVNRHGGNASIVHFPQIGIYGNTHFPFSDLNNLQIADELSLFLKNHDLD